MNVGMNRANFLEALRAASVAYTKLQLAYDEESRAADDLGGEIMAAEALRRRVAELESKCRALEEECDYMAQELHELQERSKASDR